MGRGWDRGKKNQRFLTCTLQILIPGGWSSMAFISSSFLEQKLSYFDDFRDRNTLFFDYFLPKTTTYATFMFFERESIWTSEIVERKLSENDDFGAKNCQKSVLFGTKKMSTLDFFHFTGNSICQESVLVEQVLPAKHSSTLLPGDYRDRTSTTSAT